MRTFPIGRTMAFSDDPSRPRQGPAPARGPAGPSELPIGFRLDEFVIQQVLGRGGFGIVYLARDLQLDRLVAIKEFMPTALAQRQPDLRIGVLSARHQETFDVARHSFLNEAKLLAHFDHPALVKVFRFWEDRGTAYMAMPYYQGMTLKQRLGASEAPPNEAFLRGLLDPVLDALGHLHAENCFHRDIAPDNIMLLTSGLPLLIDFGAARMVIGDATQALTAILKSGYAPIEQYAESSVMRQGPWTDIYALAAVIYFAIGGRAPPASVARLASDEMRPAAEIGRERYSPEFLAMVDACLAIKPAGRPQSAADVRRLLAIPASPPRSASSDPEQTVILAGNARAPAHGDRGEEGPTVAVPKPAASRGAAAAGRAEAPVGDRGHRERAGALSLSWPSLLPWGGGLAVLCALALWWWHGSTTRQPVAEVRPPPPQVYASAPQAGAAATRPGVLADINQAASAPHPPPVMRKLPTEAFDAVALAIGEAPSPHAVEMRSLTAPTLAIGKDDLRLQVISREAGYLYLLLAERGADRLQLLFPNKLDKGNTLRANAKFELPRRGWSAPATKPAGERRVLAVVSEAPRTFAAGVLTGDGLFATIDLGREPLVEAGKPLPYLGVPACKAQTSPCSARYAAADLSVLYAPERAPAKASTSKACVDALEQWSAGAIDTAALNARQAQLHCNP